MIGGHASRCEKRVTGNNVRSDECVLKVECSKLSFGGEDLAAKSIGTGRANLSARCGANACCLDDRWKVNFINELIPLDDARIEAEVALIFWGLVVPKCQQAVEAIDGFAFGVCAVDLDIAKGPFGLFALFFNCCAPLGLFAAQGERAEDAFGTPKSFGRSFELALDSAAAGKRPGRHDDGLALGVVQRTLLEPRADKVDQAAVVQRVLRTRGNLNNLRFELGALCGDRNDRSGNKIDRNDVDNAFGNAGEFFEKTACVTDDDRLGHTESANPAGNWFSKRRFNNRRTHDADRHIAAGFNKRTLAEGFCVGVRVGPSE